jgi:hypothetical protein
MATEGANDLKAFNAFIEELLTNGGTALTVDEALLRWEYENGSEVERDETLQAIRQGLSDLDAGRTRPLEEFDREFRAKHGLPARS